MYGRNFRAIPLNAYMELPVFKKQLRLRTPSFRNKAAVELML